MNYEPFECVMLFVFVRRAGSVFRDPFTEEFPGGRFIGVVVVASEQKNLQIGSIAQSRNLVPAFLRGSVSFRR